MPPPPSTPKPAHQNAVSAAHQLDLIKKAPSSRCSPPQKTTLSQSPLQWAGRFGAGHQIPPECLTENGLLQKDSKNRTLLEWPCLTKTFHTIPPKTLSEKAKTLLQTPLNHPPKTHPPPQHTGMAQKYPSKNQNPKDRSHPSKHHPPEPINPHSSTPQKPPKKLIIKIAESTKKTQNSCMHPHPMESLWTQLQCHAHRLLGSSEAVLIEKAILQRNPQRIKTLLQPTRMAQMGPSLPTAHDWICLNLQQTENDPHHQNKRLEILNIILEARPHFDLYDRKFQKGDTLLTACHYNQPEHARRIALQMKKEGIPTTTALQTAYQTAKANHNRPLCAALESTGLLPKHNPRKPLKASQLLFEHQQVPRRPSPVNLTPPPPQTLQPPPLTLTPFEFGIKANNIPYCRNGAFYLKGTPKLKEGWKLHASATPENAAKVLGVLLPLLQKEKVCHKFLLPEDFQKKTPESNTFDKLITIYPDSPKDAASLLKLIDNTLLKAGLTEARWKKSPENQWGKSKMLSYRYGGFTKTTITRPDGTSVPDNRANPNQVPDTLRKLLQSEPHHPRPHL